MQTVLSLLMFLQSSNEEDSELLLTRIFALIIFIVLGSLVYLAIGKWFIPPKKKHTKEYEKEKYKNIDGC